MASKHKIKIESVDPSIIRKSANRPEILKPVIAANVCGQLVTFVPPVTLNLIRVVIRVLSRPKHTPHRAKAIGTQLGKSISAEIKAGRFPEISDPSLISKEFMELSEPQKLGLYVGCEMLTRYSKVMNEMNLWIIGVDLVFTIRADYPPPSTLQYFEGLD